MTRKDYILLASALKANRAEYTSVTAQAVVLCAAQRIADVLASDNPNFDRVRFMRAVEGNGN